MLDEEPPEELEPRSPIVVSDEPPVTSPEDDSSEDVPLVVGVVVPGSVVLGDVVDAVEVEPPVASPVPLPVGGSPSHARARISVDASRRPIN